MSETNMARQKFDAFHEYDFGHFTNAYEYTRSLNEYHKASLSSDHSQQEYIKRAKLAQLEAKSILRKIVHTYLEENKGIGNQSDFTSNLPVPSDKEYHEKFPFVNNTAAETCLKWANEIFEVESKKTKARRILERNYIASILILIITSTYIYAFISG